MTTVVVHSWLWSLRDAEGVEVVSIQEMSLAEPDVDHYVTTGGLAASVEWASLKTLCVIVPYGAAVIDRKGGPRLFVPHLIGPPIEVLSADDVVIKALEGRGGYAFAPLAGPPISISIAKGGQG